MIRKYISQRTDTNFIYPNNDRSQYDVEIIHDINDNYMTNCTAAINSYTATTSQMTFSSRYSMDFNNAEKYIDDLGLLHVFSVHMLAPGQDYYKPWRCIYVDRNAVTGNQTYSGSATNFSVTATNMGLPTSGFTSGTYYLEFRFIGKRVVIPVCLSVNVTSLPTPTPTATVPIPTATPTPTPTATASFNGTTGITLNVTDTGYIKYDTALGTTYKNVTSTGTYIITDCADCSTVRQGIPFADLAVFTITNCGNPC